MITNNLQINNLIKKGITFSGLFIINIIALQFLGLLKLTIIAPLVGVLIILSNSSWDNKKLHIFALYFSVYNFLLTLYLLAVFDKTIWDFQFGSIFILNPFLSKESALFFGIDGISLYFLVLTNLFIYLCVLSLSKTQARLKEYIVYLFLLQWSMLCAFSVLDIIGFFIFFEATLIPIFFIILIWGSRGRKVRASYLIALYTLFGSIFMLFSIMYIYSKTGTTNYLFLLKYVTFTENDQRFLWLMFFIAFAAKIPLFPLHVWLPEAHVEAPTIGSVLLAALLLKLGTYGIIRFALPLFPLGTVYYTPLVYTFAICGIIYTSLTAIRQVDLKKIIAYSSVGHMNVVLIGIMTLRLESLEGAIFQMLSHGIVSGALFLCVGVIYDRHATRFIKYFGGLTYTAPLLSMFFLIFSMANISFPGTSSFVGEFLILAGIFKESSWVAFMTATSMVLGAVYTLWVYNRVFFGNIKNLNISKFLDVNKKEFSILLILTIILFYMGIYPKHFFDVFHASTFNLITICKNYIYTLN